MKAVSSKREKCPLCQLPLGSTKCTDSHIRSEGGADQVTYKCRMCKYYAMEEKEMEEHMKVHTEEKLPCSSHLPFGVNRNSHTTDDAGTVDKGRYPLSIR